MPAVARCEPRTSSSASWARLEGVLVGWDYQAAFSWNENELTDKLPGGYNDDTMVFDGIIQGIINPFGPQSAAGTAVRSRAAALQRRPAERQGHRLRCRRSRQP